MRTGLDLVGKHRGISGRGRVRIPPVVNREPNEIVPVVAVEIDARLLVGNPDKLRAVESIVAVALVPWRPGVIGCPAVGAVGAQGGHRKLLGAGRRNTVDVAERYVEASSGPLLADDTRPYAQRGALRLEYPVLDAARAWFRRAEVDRRVRAVLREHRQREAHHGRAGLVIPDHDIARPHRFEWKVARRRRAGRCAARDRTGGQPPAPRGDRLKRGMAVRRRRGRRAGSHFAQSAVDRVDEARIATVAGDGALGALADGGPFPG